MLRRLLLALCMISTPVFILACGSGAGDSSDGEREVFVCEGNFVVKDDDPSEWRPDHTWVVLSELSKCTEITGELLIYYNDALTSLEGLENLTAVGGNLEIFVNDALESLSALENLTSVGEDLLIIYNPALTSLVGLENLTSVGGNLIIENNDFLTSLVALNNLTTVNGLGILYNNALTNCEALWLLFNIETIGTEGSYIVPNTVTGSCNHQICGAVQWGDTMIGVPFLVTDDEDVADLLLGWNPYNVRVELSDLSECEIIAGSLQIIASNLTSLTGLENLTSMGGGLEIIFNPNLTSLVGLENINSIGRLQNSFFPYTPGFLSIRENDVLPNCEVEWLRENIGVGNIGGEITIENNTGTGTCP